MKDSEFFDRLDKIMSECNVLRWYDILDKYSARFVDGDIKGIYYVKDRRYWRVSKMIDGKRYHIGTYEDKLEAIQAYRKFRSEL